jgi:hypothetical protein
MSTITSSYVSERVARLMRVLGLLCVLGAGSLGATEKWTAASVLPGSAERWMVLGDAELRWLGLRIYNAALWVPQGSRWSSDRPFALEIRYGRAIKSRRLVEVSLEEMQRMGVAEAVQLEAWRAALETAFPDVERDDTIIGLRKPDGGVSFFHRGETTVEIDDPAFAQAFFAIWLDERTREPAMRKRLLGQSNGN